MTNGWAIKDKDGKIVHVEVEASETEAWEMFHDRCSHQPDEIEEWKERGYTCTKVTVQESAQAGSGEAVGQVLSEEEMGIGWDRRSGDVIWWNKPKGPAFLYAHPPASADEGMVTDAMLKAGDLFFTNPSFVSVSPAQIRSIYLAMLAARKS